jgi:nicotinate-nucleotide adenylyltransferase
MIGLFGGTFDPVHFGHLRPGWEVREQLSIDDFRWLPAGQPAHRAGAVTAAHHRLAMLRLAVEGLDAFRIDERELQRPGPSYMVDSLREIRAESGERPVLLIIGQDSAASLDTWHRWRTLFDLAHIVIMQRPGQPDAESGAVRQALAERSAREASALRAVAAGLVYRVRVSQLAVSSSAIRKLVRAGRSPRFLLPDAVLEYVERQGLYR